MRPGKRFGLSSIEKSDIWSRWKAGQSLHEIRRAFDKPHNSIRCLLLPRGGIPPAARSHSHLALTLAEREDISPGDRVKRGQILARVAASGDAREPHLYFEVTTSSKILAGEGVPSVID